MDACSCTNSRSEEERYLLFTELLLRSLGLRPRPVGHRCPQACLARSSRRKTPLIVLQERFRGNPLPVSILRGRRQLREPHRQAQYSLHSTVYSSGAALLFTGDLYG